ncbi:hypothetical protein T11_4428 [Trichinella zimbabwensis]|uniref:Uncharacterized protein n=1 Tax=Trichinella zimbabwensis TaxID=268475 RepID=A0A0V1DLV4_9BILA|nr:hypothetical protein T11_4428 [Trichinella zimbabwensis]
MEMHKLQIEAILLIRTKSSDKRKSIFYINLI